MTSSSTIAFLLAAHRDSLLAFAERRLRSRATAEDVVQQASLRALDRADQLRDSSAGRAWLFQITRRLVADQFRVQPTMAASDDIPAHGSESTELSCDCVLANLRRLPQAEASILRRSIVDGVPASALAAELGVSINAATVRLSRARAALREQLRTHCGTHSLRECLDCACTVRGCCAEGEAS